MAFLSLKCHSHISLLRNNYMLCAMQIWSSSTPAPPRIVGCLYILIPSPPLLHLNSLFLCTGCYGRCCIVHVWTCFICHNCVYLYSSPSNLLHVMPPPQISHKLGCPLLPPPLTLLIPTCRQIFRKIIWSNVVWSAPKDLHLHHMYLLTMLCIRGMGSIINHHTIIFTIGIIWVYVDI